MDILYPIPQMRILSLLLTLQCNAECMPCGTNSSPRVKSRLQQAIASRLIDEAIEADYQVVAFTGGEPRLYGSSLFDLVRRAALTGLTTRVVANALRARTADSAGAIASTLARRRAEGNKLFDRRPACSFCFHELRYPGSARGTRPQVRVAVMTETVKERRSRARPL